MSPEPAQTDWQRVKHVFQTAVDLPTEQRGRFLDEACKGKPDLRAAVESLLSSHDDAGDFLEESPAVVKKSVPRPVVTQDWAGRRIGSYEIIERIGRGGMGIVYRARDVRLGRDAALKLLPHDLACDPRALERFYREARAASALNHPNICTIYGIEEVDDQVVIAMEMLEGQTLEQRIGGRPLRVAELLDIGIQVAEGLEAARSRGFIHRDIKPANTFITTSGVVKILDFGLAKVAPDQKTTQSGVNPSGLTGTGMAIGTVAYMSPEQARGEMLDARSDLFSFGAVLYEMATGRQAFQGASFAVVFDAILNRSPEPPSSLNPAIPAELERIINKALEKERDVRYQTASDLAADLRRLKRDTESGRIERLLEPSRALRRRGFNWVAVPVALASIVALLFVLASRPAPMPRVLRTVQITQDSQDKLLYQPGGVVTDGSRIYFSEATPGGSSVLMQASAQAQGSDTIRVPSPFPNTGVLDISRKRSELLVVAFVQNESEYALWRMPLIGAPPARVGNVFAHGGAFTSDGQQILFLFHDGVYRANVDGSDVRAVAKLPGTTWDLHLSPDDRRASVSVNRANGTELWEVSLHNGRAAPLLAGFSNPPAECCGSWTSDGHYFLFQTWRGDGTKNIWAMLDNSGWLRMSGPRPVQVTAGPFNFWRPVASPDGRRIFVIGDNQRGELLRVDTRSGLFSPYLSGISAEGVAFSRDGQWVCWISFPDGALWRSRNDGTERLQLSNAPLTAYQPQWSPDGTRIAFMGKTPTTDWKLYMVPADGGVPLPLLRDDPRPQADPQWMPDGSAIIFGRWAFAEEPGAQVDIRALDLGTNQVRSLPGTHDLWSPRVSPDGRWLTASARNASKLMLADTSTWQWAELAPQDAGFPNWAHDSSAVWFSSPEGRDIGLFRADIHKRQVEHMTRLDLRLTGSVGRWIGLTPDDLPLVLRNAGSQEIYAIDWAVQ
ncbi:MAG TPA: protein kinase [Bryobacteraceae bacterium]|nr:protein kinase [Bryobacteraceae bacterium]